jgi:hypothetical protein
MVASMLRFKDSFHDRFPLDVALALNLHPLIWLDFSLS